jgi:Uncharacterized protein conserved in bacteria
MNATSHLGMADYGKIMVGDKGFEFYDDRDTNNYIQIPWTEVRLVIVSVIFGGRWIPRFAIETKKNGTFPFQQEILRRHYVLLGSISDQIISFVHLGSSKLLNGLLQEIQIKRKSLRNKGTIFFVFR